MAQDDKKMIIRNDELAFLNERLRRFGRIGEPLKESVDFIKGGELKSGTGAAISYFFSMPALSELELFMREFGFSREDMAKAYLRLHPMLRCRATSGHPSGDWLMEIDPARTGRAW